MNISDADFFPWSELPDDRLHFLDHTSPTNPVPLHDTNLGSLIPDNDLLREIGTQKIPAKGPEEEKKWRDGLTAVVHELRSTNRGKDVAVIAQRIAEYRREFIGDPTKTLLLD